MWRSQTADSPVAAERETDVDFTHTVKNAYLVSVITERRPIENSITNKDSAGRL